MIIKMNFILGLALILVKIYFIKALDLKESTTEDLISLKNLSKENITSEINDEINRLKDFLPKSVENLAFAKTICIRNFDTNEYLYAASDGFKYDGDRRRLFTWRPGGKVGQGLWVLEKGKEGYYVKNKYHNEYLYAAIDDFNYGWPRLPGRRLFTWVPGGHEGDNPQFEWQFRPIRNVVHIINVKYNEALQLHETYDSDRREVAAKKEIPFTGAEWAIEEC